MASLAVFWSFPSWTFTKDFLKMRLWICQRYFTSCFCVLKPQMKKKRLESSVAIPPKVYMTGDAQSLESAFTNLLDNAIKFVPEGGRVEVRVARESEDLQLCIFNTYGKLTDKELESLFEPFYRVADASEAGTGLGPCHC